MKTIRLTILSVLFASACCLAQSKSGANKNSFKMIDQIIGTWQMSTGTSIGKSPANMKTHPNPNAAGNELSGPPPKIRFKRDMRYIANADDKTVLDSGSFRVNENHKRLYLQSDLTNHEPTEWDVILNKNQMILQADSVKNKNHIRYAYEMTGH